MASVLGNRTDANHHSVAVRDSLVSSLHDNGLADEPLAIVSAMTLGDKSMLSREIRTDFSSTGASHVLALSGLHLSILYFLLSFVLPRRRWRWLVAGVSLALIWSYAFLVGMSTSIVRAALMLSVFVVARLMNRPSLSLNSLAFAALVIVLANPSSVFEISFQLSFMAVLSIITVFPALYNLFSDEFLLTHRLFRILWSFVLVSVAAQLGTAPLILHYFGTFPTYFLLTNCIVIPAAYIIVGGGMLMLLHIFPTTIASLLSFVVVKVRLGLSFISSLPGATVTDAYLTTAQVVVIYAVAFALGFFVYYLKQRSQQAAQRVPETHKEG